jgi:hypothetical protein
VVEILLPFLCVLRAVLRAVLREVVFWGSATVSVAIVGVSPTIDTQRCINI